VSRRSAVALASLALTAASCSMIYRHQHPVCGPRPATRLIAESVPGAALVPCVRSLPIGWSFAGFEASDGTGTFWLNSETGGEHAAEVTLVANCRPRGRERPGGTQGARRYVDVLRGVPYHAVWTETFPGGCVRYLLTFQTGARTDRLLSQLEHGLSLIPRRLLG
jgi:hypothetical protein